MINCLQIPILYESNEILAIHKPPGVPHHTSAGELGIVALIREQYSQHDPTTRLYSVHRLDRVTSAARELTRLFREKKIVKYYTALSLHKPVQKKQGWIQGGMERGRRKSWKLVRAGTTNYAQTRFFSAGLGHLGAESKNSTTAEDTMPAAPRTLLLLRPYTGKTHQLRVAAKSVGLPLAGDPIYKDRYDSSAILDRAYLHAMALEIIVSDDSCFDREEFDEVLQRLVDKHCESPEICSLCRDFYANEDGSEKDS